MTQQSLSNSQEASSSASSSGNSASTSATDVYPLPFSFGQKEIVQNSDERRLVTDFIDNNVVAPLAPGANICITDSSDVLVGNPTYFNSDVTIYQYINGNRLPELQNGGVPGQDEVQCNKNGQVLNSETKPSSQKFSSKDFKQLLLKDRPTQLWIVGIFLTLMGIVTLAIYFSVSLTHTASTLSPSSGHDDDLGDGIQVIQRKEWLGQPPLNVTKLAHPLKMARILHTAGSNCKDYQTCANKVLALQGWQVASQGMPDLAYNYMIGGDGNVYVGRGPGVANEWMPQAIDIGYIGNFLAPYDKMTDKMDMAGKRLIAYLKKKGYLTPDYIVVAQNQTLNTQSPGENIYKRMITWPHYDSGLYFP